MRRLSPMLAESSGHISEALNSMTIQIQNPLHGEMNKCAIALHQHSGGLRSELEKLDEALRNTDTPDWSGVHAAVARIRYHATGMSREAQTSWTYKRAVYLLEGGRR